MESTTNNQEFSEQILALAKYLSVDPTDIEEEYRDTYSINGEEYRVLTDDEAEQAYEDWLDNYLEEVIYPEIPDSYIYYFDNGKWKRDARINGSRGEALNSYDGGENIENVEGTVYYIYRTN